MPSPSARSGSESNLLWAVSLLTIAAGGTAFASAWTAGFVLDNLQNTEALALIVTDGGLRSDSQSLERNMSSATLALRSVQDLGLALAFGCLAVAVAVGFRLWKGKDTPCD